MGAQVITDASGLYALVDRKERHHQAVGAVLDADPGLYFLPTATLAEATNLIERRLAPQVPDKRLADLEAGDLVPDGGEGDFAHGRALVRRYHDLPLGFVDAAVIGCAERHGGRVLTLGLRHFGVVGREGRLTLLPG